MNHITTMKKKRTWKTWWTLCRPHTLTASFIPVLIGTVYTLEEHNNTHFHLLLFLTMLLASILIQAATNMFNEYFDYKRGLDTAESVGIGGTIVREGVKPSYILYLAWILFGVSLLLGVYICSHTNWWIALIGTICMLVAYLYSGGPYPIAYTPFGELASGFFMGFVIILISYFIQTGEITTSAIMITLPTSFFIGAINLSNNIRDLDNDKENGRKTLAILVGKKYAIVILASIFIIAYLWTISLSIMHIISMWGLISLLSIPMPIQSVKIFIQNTTPIKMMPAMKFTAQTNTTFGFLFSIGLLVGYILSLW